MDNSRPSSCGRNDDSETDLSAFTLKAEVKRFFSSRARLKFLPFLKTAKNYTRQQAKADLKAAVNVSILDFPQSMAYAMIAGLPVQHGILGSAFSSITGPFFASSRFVMLGPTNATAVLLLAGLMSIDLPPEQWPVALPLLLLMVAGLMIFGAVFRVANFVQYISRTVVTGYIAAAALLIIVNQIPTACGYAVARKATFAQAAVENLSALPAYHTQALLTSLFTLACFYLSKRFLPKLPAVAIALAAATAFAAGMDRFSAEAFWDYEAVGTLSIADIRATLPRVNLAWIGALAFPAFAIAFLAILESTSIAKSLGARSGDRVDVNQQMFSLGITNVVNAFGGGMPASGSLTRSTLNWASGAKTCFASLYSGIFILAALCFLGPLMRYVPKAALAALVIAIGISLLRAQNFRLALRSTKSDATAFVATFVGGLLFPLDTAIYTGAAVSIVLFLKKAAIPELSEIVFNEEGELAEKKGGAALRDIPDISIVHVEGDLFFGAADLFLDQARILVADPNKKIIILRMRNARNLDATCAAAIADLVRFARSKDRWVLISGAHPDIERVLVHSGVLGELGRENFFRLVPGNPNISTRNALKRAQALLGQDDANIVIYASSGKRGAAGNAAGGV